MGKEKNHLFFIFSEWCFLFLLALYLKADDASDCLWLMFALVNSFRPVTFHSTDNNGALDGLYPIQ